MRETRLKERFEAAINTFFDNEKLNGNNDLSFVNNTVFSKSEETDGFASRHTTLINILKQIFLFLPGAFVLFFMSVAFTGFLILRPTPGAEHHLYLAFLVFIISALMTFLGLGDWRKPKYLLIPISIISVSAILGLMGSWLYGVEGFGYFIDHYAVYFLPLAFVVPFLAKGLIDKSENQ